MGIDSSPEAVEFCKRKFKGSSNISIFFKRAEEILALETKFEVITALDILEHLLKPERVLSAINLSLIPSGQVIVTTPNWPDKILIKIKKNDPHKSAHSAFGWAKLVKKSGFKIKVLRTVDFPLLHWDILCRKLHLLGMCVLIVAEK